MTKTACRLFLPVEPRRFRDEAKLRKALAKQDTTTLIPIKNWEFLQLDKEGRLGDGYRFSAFAMGQFCSWLAPGLTQVVASLQHDAKDLAIKLLNAFVRRRFKTALAGSRLLVDRRAMRIDGLVGSRYQLLSNMDLLEQCRVFATNDHCIFHEAILEGRRLLLRYRKRVPAFRIATRDDDEAPLLPFCMGWHFSNSEVGDRSIHVAQLLIRSEGYAASLPQPTKIQRLVHIQSPDFTQKVTELLERQLRKTFDTEMLQHHLRRLCRTSLGASNRSLEEANAFKQQLAAKLVKAKLPVRIAERVVQRVLVRSGEKAAALDFREVGQAFLAHCGERTVFDLYNSLTQLAVFQDIKRREKMEQLAYRLLVNRFTI